MAISANVWDPGDGLWYNEQFDKSSCNLSYSMLTFFLLSDFKLVDIRW